MLSDMKYYFLVLVAVVALAVSFCLTKKYQKNAGDGFIYGLLFNIFCGFLTAVCFLVIAWVIDGNALRLTRFSVILAVLMAVFSGAYTIIGFRIMAHGSVAIYTLFLMLGGMMLPYFYGLLFLSERFSVLRLCGLVLMILSLTLSATASSQKEKKNSLLFFVLCVSVFILNGGVSIVSKIHQLPENSEIAVSSAQFVVLVSVIKTILFAFVLLGTAIFQRRYKNRQAIKTYVCDFRIYLLILGIAVAGGVSYLFQLIGASHLPATSLYPMITGGSVVFSSLSAYVVFKEKLSRRETVGIILCFVSTFFFL